MKKIILTADQVTDLIGANKYKIEEGQKSLSRCVDGRYPTSLKFRGASENLPPLALPGADAGELALIFAAANIYGFEIDEEKVFASLLEVVEGAKNFNFHSDQHGDPKTPASGCGHIKQMTLDPKAYNLEEKQVVSLKKFLSQAKKQGAKETVLEGKHLEGAVLQLRGDFSLYPRYSIQANEGKSEIQVFIYQADLVNPRHRVWAQQLEKSKAVKLFPGCDGEYLYQVLSEVTENHLFETLRRLAKGLPIFQVDFNADGSFKVEELGKV